MKESVGISYLLRRRAFFIYLLFLAVFIFGKPGKVNAKEIKMTTESGAVLLFEKSGGICTFQVSASKKLRLLFRKR